MQDSLKPLVGDGLQRTRDSNGRAVFVVRSDWTPPVIKDRDVAIAAASARNDLQAVLAGADPEWIMGRSGALLAHFYVADIPASVQAAVADDWADALEEYPGWAIQAAVRIYVKTERRRPTIADIVERCEELVSEPRAWLQVTQRLIDAIGETNG